MNNVGDLLRFSAEFEGFFSRLLGKCFFVLFSGSKGCGIMLRAVGLRELFSNSVIFLKSRFVLFGEFWF